MVPTCFQALRVSPPARLAGCHFQCTARCPRRHFHHPAELGCLRPRTSVCKRLSEEVSGCSCQHKILKRNSQNLRTVGTTSPEFPSAKWEIDLDKNLRFPSNSMASPDGFLMFCPCLKSIVPIVAPSPFPNIYPFHPNLPAAVTRKHEGKHANHGCFDRSDWKTMARETYLRLRCTAQIAMSGVRCGHLMWLAWNSKTKGCHSVVFPSPFLAHLWIFSPSQPIVVI